MPIEAALRLARALRGGEEEPRRTTPQITALRDPEALARAMEFRESVMAPTQAKRPIDEQASWYSAAGYTPQDIRGGMRGITSSPSAIARASEMAMGMGPGATVFHGSPHRFEKFDASKIGTGEGAQAYGHGLYFAENPEVAKQYLPMTNKELGLPEWSSRKPKGAFYHVDLPDEQIARMIDWDKPLSGQSPEVQQAVKKLWEESRVYGDPTSLTGEGIHGSLTAHHLGVGMERGAGKEAAAQDLRHYGIPGIRYLDQGSRGASGTGKWRVTYKDGKSELFDFKPNDDVLQQLGATAKPEGTSNFVVFNPEILKILRRESAGGDITPAPAPPPPVVKALRKPPELTMDDVKKIEHLSTPQKMQMAIDRVGDQEFMRRVTERIEKEKRATKKTALDPHTEAMLVEATAIEIAARRE